MHANKKLSAFVELERQVLTVKTAEGEDALFILTTGNNNTATGFEALFFNTSGSSNTTNGAGVLFSNIIGGCNTANGVLALSGNTTGGNNTATGPQCTPERYHWLVHGRIGALKPVETSPLGITITISTTEVLPAGLTQSASAGTRTPLSPGSMG